MQNTNRLMQSSVGLFVAVLAVFLFTGCKSETSSGKMASNPPAAATTTAAPEAVPTPPVAPAPAVAPTPAATPAPAPVLPPVRIKAGPSDSFKDAEGNVWLSERGFADGDSFEKPDAEIANTKSPAIYRSERYGMTSFSYPVPNGKYTVKLHFAEIYEGITGPGGRVFSFNVEGHEFNDFDVWVKAGGPLRAYIETVNVEVTDGKLDISFAPKEENPKISGIEILPPAAAPAPVPPPIRIKAGRFTSFTDAEGNVWLPDQGFADGETTDRPDDLQIANTKSPALYRSERYSMTSFSYKLPNGKYTVKLHFAETYEGISGPGERVFSFNVEGHEFKDFDVWVKAGGPLRAYIETVNVEVTDGKLDISFTPNVENPEINGIEILPGS